MDSLPPTQTKHQTPRLLYCVILASRTLLSGPLWHLRQLTVQLPTLELRPMLIHIQALHLLMFLFRRSQVLHTTTSIVLTSHPAWSTRSNSRSLPTPTIPGELFIEEIPMSGLSKCRDPEHYFYGLSGNWEWSLRTADYWRHHFEIPLVHGHHPFHNVPIETSTPTEATRFTAKIQDLAKQLSTTLTAAMASGEINDTWRMVEDMSFRDALQTLQAEANLPSE